MFNFSSGPSEIERLLQTEKTFSDWPVWQSIGDSIDGAFSFATGVAIGGVSAPGVRVRSIASRGLPARDLIVQLEILCDRNWAHACRLEYLPVRGHFNPFNRRDLPRTIGAGISHIHRFADNWAYGGLSALSPTANLPVARALEPPPSSVKNFFRIVAAEIGIPDFENIEPPRWQGRLL
jgi:hypothetical protein